MSDKIKANLCILGLIMLVIMGLNASNQGINQVAGMNQDPVFGIIIDAGQAKIQSMGNEYVIDRNSVEKITEYTHDQAGHLMSKIDYFLGEFLDLLNISSFLRARSSFFC